MSGFKSWAVYQKYYGEHNDDLLFKLREDLSYTTMDGACYVVHSGFLSDLGSIPRILWPILPPNLAPSAFILHDYLCKQDWISRGDSNKILYEALRLSHVTSFKSSVIYWGCWLYAKVRRIK